MFDKLLAPLQQYLVYILLGCIAALSVACVGLGVTVWAKNKDISVLQAQVKAEKATVTARDTTIADYRARTDEMLQRAKEFDDKTASLQKRHKKELDKLRGDKFPTVCRDAADYAVERMGDVIPDSWR